MGPIKKFTIFSVCYFLTATFTPTAPYSVRSALGKDEEETTTAPNYGKEATDKPTSSLLKQCDPCPAGIDCVPQIQCPAHVRMAPSEHPQTCDLAAGKHGFCCLTGQNHSAPSNLNVRSFVIKPDLTMAIIEEARAKFAAVLDHPSVAVQQGQPEFFHNIMFHASGNDVMKNLAMSNTAMEQIFASQLFKEHESIPMEEFELNNVIGDFNKSPLGHYCANLPVCTDPNRPHRSPDGSCNNMLPGRSLWGAAGQPMEHLLPPAYEDGIWAPRSLSIDGSPLANARRISRTVLPDIDQLHPRNNLLTMQFGQFIGHDVTQSASVTLENGDAIQCCSGDGSTILPPEQSHFACFPIPIDSDDEFYKLFNQGCMNFVRLSLAPPTNCKIGYGKQLSRVTHFLDGSQIYGSNQATQNELRTFRGGKLRMLDDFGRDLLPLDRDPASCGATPTQANNVCFKSGDGRTNQIISLVAMHTIFAREHNRIVDLLSRLNPHFSDELLFQEARRIVIAEYQHIAYNEYLPQIIGTVTMKRFSLNPKHHGYAKDYNPDVNPSVTNEFTAAAFRFGHSTVDGKFEILHRGGQEQVIDIPDVMFNPGRMRKQSFLDNLLRGLVSQPMQKVDESVSHGLSRFLFRGNNPFGLDLASLNIQRGRDEGLRAYNDYLEVMGHRRIKSFQEFRPEIAQRLSQVYKYPDDIDLWIGGLLEPVQNDGVVGVTFAEIIADQFSRFRRGDRYFYEYSPEINPGAFTPNQLREIRKVTMARIVCDNADHFTFHEAPPSAFLRSDLHGNHPVSCSNIHKIPVMDLSPWKA